MNTRMLGIMLANYIHTIVLTYICFLVYFQGQKFVQSYPVFLKEYTSYRVSSNKSSMHIFH